MSSERAFDDDLAAVLARRRAQVDDPVGRAHHRLVVLDDEHRVAEVAQPLERRIRRSSSAGWRPIDGSSQTYSTPISDEPICVARRMRCASPPESVAVRRSSVR